MRTKNPGQELQTFEKILQLERQRPRQKKGLKGKKGSRRKLKRIAVKQDQDAIKEEEGALKN